MNPVETSTKFALQAPADCNPKMDWVHIPTPGDHYSPATGSAIMTIIYEISRVHDEAGGRTRVLVNQGTRTDHYPVGEVVEVSPSPENTRAKKLIDTAGARLGMRRRFGERRYQSHAHALDPGFEGVIFVHNDPVALRILRRRCPNAVLCLWANNQLWRPYADREVASIARSVDRLICCSGFIAEDSKRRLPAGLHDTVRVVMSGVNTAAFKPPAERPANPEPIILFVGRMVPVKGVHILIEAAKQLAAEGLKFKVRIVGSQGFTDKAPLSAYEQSVRDLAAPLGDRVVFTPFVVRDQIASQYHAADIFCVPSVWDEPLGLVVAEGMASSLPVVAAKRGGIPEVGGDAARYFEPDEPDSLARTLKPLLDDADSRSSLGKISRLHAETLSWAKAYTSLTQCIIKSGANARTH